MDKINKIEHLIHNEDRICVAVVCTDLQDGSSVKVLLLYDYIEQIDVGYFFTTELMENLNDRSIRNTKGLIDTLWHNRKSNVKALKEQAEDLGLQKPDDYEPERKIENVERIIAALINAKVGDHVVDIMPFQDFKEEKLVGFLVPMYTMNQLVNLSKYDLSVWLMGTNRNAEHTSETLQDAWKNDSKGILHSDWDKNDHDEEDQDKEDSEEEEICNHTIIKSAIEERLGFKPTPSQVDEMVDIYKQIEEFYKRHKNK